MYFGHERTSHSSFLDDLPAKKYPVRGASFWRGPGAQLSQKRAENEEHIFGGDDFGENFVVHFGVGWHLLILYDTLLFPRRISLFLLPP